MRPRPIFLCALIHTTSRFLVGKEVVILAKPCAPQSDRREGKGERGNKQKFVTHSCMALRDSREQVPDNQVFPASVTAYSMHLLCCGVYVRMCRRHARGLIFHSSIKCPTLRHKQSRTIRSSIRAAKMVSSFVFSYGIFWF